MGPVYRALRADKKAFDTICCVTGQHRGLLDEALRIFDIRPDFDFDLMREGQELAGLTAGVLKAMGSVLRDHRPDVLLVHGDTTTSMASALAAFYAGVPVGHVEAGMRTNDLGAPFPEELNRRSTAMIAAYHFAPTELNRANLIAEGCDPASICVTGNTVVDAVNTIGALCDHDPTARNDIVGQLNSALSFDWRSDRFVVITCHRRETYATSLAGICAAIAQLSKQFPQDHFIFPLHPNPAVRKPVLAMLATSTNVHLVNPMPYDAFLFLLRRCHFLLTDSGGLQEEGPSLGKPVLIMRENTERPESIVAGGAMLVGTTRQTIVAGAGWLLSDHRQHARMAEAPNPFGDGRAAERIASFLKGVLRLPRAGIGASSPASRTLCLSRATH